MAWNEAVVTNQGMNLLSKAFINGNIVITKAIGSESYTDPVSLLAQTQISEPNHALQIAKIDIIDNAIAVDVRIQNNGLATSYILRKVGLFAKLAGSDEEILFAVIQDRDGELIPSESENKEFLVEFIFAIPVSNADKISIDITPNTFALEEDLQRHTTDKVMHITAGERKGWDDKAEKDHSHPEATDTEAGFLAAADKEKLDGIEEGANNYSHPDTHHADIITQDSTHRFVTDAEKSGWNKSLESAKDYANDIYQQAAGYTDQKVADLIGGAPETLDTLKEVADAIEENKDVVTALDAAIGTKANQTELDTHTGNGTIHVTATEKEKWDHMADDISDSTATFVSEDNSTNPSSYMVSFSLLKSPMKLKDILYNVSAVFKNMRYVWGRLTYTPLNTTAVFTASLPNGVVCNNICKWGGSLNLFFAISTTYTSSNISLTLRSAYKPYFTVLGVYSTTSVEDYNKIIKHAMISSAGGLTINLGTSARSETAYVNFNYPVGF